MRKSNEAVWYDWVGPSGYEGETQNFEQAPVITLVEETVSLQRRVLLKGRCFCSPRVAESR